MHEHENPATKAPVPVPPTPEEVRRGSGTGLAVLVGLIVLAAWGGGWPLLVMIGAIVLMIFLHELGHYLTAKSAGMKVTEYFLGFGPRIWSFRRGETEYGIKAIPAGAYVKIVGMHNLDEFDPADADRTYMSKPYWRRLSVAVAGSAMHFLLAIVALFAMFAFAGAPGGAFPGEAWVVADRVDPESPAGLAGVQGGDEIVSVDGVPTTSFDDFREVVAARPGETVAVSIVRDGEPMTLELTLGERNPVSHEPVGYFGVGPDDPPFETVGPLTAARESIEGFAQAVGQTFGGLAHVLSPAGLSDLGGRVVDTTEPESPAVGAGGGSGGGESDADRPISVVGVADLGADIVGDGDWARFLFLFAILNVFIGVFNLVPLLPLDGGHVAIATYEKIRSMLRGGAAYHVDVTKLLPITYAVVLVLVFLGISTVYLDIADPIGG
jgi:membrane-associated protease RseP (regulator of RpoE activity)